MFDWLSISAGKLDENEFRELNKESTEKFFNRHLADSQNSRNNNVFPQQTWLWHDEDELLAYENLFDNYHERYKKLRPFISLLLYRFVQFTVIIVATIRCYIPKEMN